MKVGLWLPHCLLPACVTSWLTLLVCLALDKLAGKLAGCWFAPNFVHDAPTNHSPTTNPRGCVGERDSFRRGENTQSGAGVGVVMLRGSGGSLT